MKKIILTNLVSEETKRLLKTLVKPKKRNPFLTQAINKVLTEKRNAMRAAYGEAEENIERKELIEDWSVLDTEGWDDEEIS